MYKDSQDCYLVNYRDSIFTEKVINKILPLITLEDNNLVNRKLYNKINLLIILDNILIANSNVVKVLLEGNLLNYIINNMSLDIGCYSMFLASMSLFIDYLKDLVYLQSDNELICCFKTFYKVQPKVKTLLSRKVEYNHKDILLNNYLIIAKYIDEVLDEGFNKLGCLYTIETSKYINWRDNCFHFSCNSTNVFSGELFEKISFESKMFCFELCKLNFNDIDYVNYNKIKRFIFELKNYCNDFYVTPVSLTGEQEQLIVDLFRYIDDKKYDKKFKLEIKNVNNSDNFKVQILASIKIFYESVVYNINLERRRNLLFLTLTPSLYGIYRISYYSINDFEHLLSEIFVDYKIRQHHIKNNYCFL